MDLLQFAPLRYLRDTSHSVPKHTESAPTAARPPKIAWQAYEVLRRDVILTHGFARSLVYETSSVVLTYELALSTSSDNLPVTFHVKNSPQYKCVRRRHYEVRFLILGIYGQDFQVSSDLSFCCSLPRLTITGHRTRFLCLAD